MKQGDKGGFFYSQQATRTERKKERKWKNKQINARLDSVLDKGEFFIKVILIVGLREIDELDECLLRGRVD